MEPLHIYDGQLSRLTVGSQERHLRDPEWHSVVAEFRHHLEMGDEAFEILTKHGRHGIVISIEIPAPSGIVGEIRIAGRVACWFVALRDANRASCRCATTRFQKRLLAPGGSHVARQIRSLAERPLLALVAATGVGGQPARLARDVAISIALWCCTD